MTVKLATTKRKTKTRRHISQETGYFGYKIGNFTNKSKLGIRQGISLMIGA